MTALAYPKNLVTFPVDRVKVAVNTTQSQGMVTNLDDYRMMSEIKAATGLTDVDFAKMQATRAMLEETMAEIMEHPTVNYDIPMKAAKHLHMDVIIPENLDDLMLNHDIDEARSVLDTELDTLTEVLGEVRVRKLTALISTLTNVVSDTSHAEGLAGGYLMSDPEMDF